MPARAEPLVTDRVQTNHSWTTEHSPDDARQRLFDAAATEGGRPELMPDGTLSVRFGSRLAYRLGGVVMGFARRRLSLRLDARITGEASGSRVDVSIAEDDGPFLMRFAFREPAMRKRMDDIISTLRQATS